MSYTTESFMLPIFSDENDRTSIMDDEEENENNLTIHMDEDYEEDKKNLTSYMDEDDYSEYNKDTPIKESKKYIVYEVEYSVHRIRKDSPWFIYPKDIEILDSYEQLTLIVAISEAIIDINDLCFMRDGQYPLDRFSLVYKPRSYKITNNSYNNAHIVL